MRRIPRKYLVNRLVTLLLTIWIAATLIWIIPRLSPVDPAEIMLSRMAAAGGTVANSEAILATLQERFGLNDPLIVQYLKYMRNVLVLDFGLSTASFPTEVSSLIARALPWTLGLMIISVIITFIIGNALGALMVWDRSPKLVRVAIPAAMIFLTSAIRSLPVVKLRPFRRNLNILASRRSESKMSNEIRSSTCSS